MVNLPNQTRSEIKEKKQKGTKPIFKPPKKKNQPWTSLLIMPFGVLCGIGVIFYLNPMSFIERLISLIACLCLVIVNVWIALISYNKMKVK